MRRQIKDFVKICSTSLDVKGPVYEFGSRQMSGQVGYSDIRPFFSGKGYVGADYIEGPGVDVVLDLRNINLPAGSVNTAFCLEVLEHVDEPARAVDELYRVLADDGILIVSVPMNIRIHGSPYDYWRFTPQGLDVLLKKFQYRFVGYVGREDYPDNIVAVVGKKPINFEKFNESYMEWQSNWRPFLHDVLVNLMPYIRPITPRIFIGDEFELWKRRRDEPGYPAFFKFIKMLSPPIVARAIGFFLRKAGRV